MPLVEVGDGSHQVYYELYGQGPIKILFTMGLAGDHLQWEPQTEHFLEKPDEFQVCVYDNRGIGLSSDVPGRWTTAKMATDALALLDELGWRSGVHLVGLSMGGMITQEIASADLPRFASIALISTAPGGVTSLINYAKGVPSGGQTLLRTVYASTPQEQLMNGLSLLYPRPFLLETSINPKTEKEELNAKMLRRALISRGARGQEKGIKPFPLWTVWRQALAVLTHRVSASRLQKMKKHFGPRGVLVITGLDDILVHSDNSAALHDALQGGLLLLPGAGHGANEQCVDDVNAALENHIRAAHQQFQPAKGRLLSTLPNGPKARL